MEPQNLVKKRGRKPKQKYIVNDNPIFDNNNSEQIIINIKKKKQLITIYLKVIIFLQCII